MKDIEKSDSESEGDKENNSPVSKRSKYEAKRFTKSASKNKHDITLTYFDMYGRAEAIRMLLSHAGIKFKDIRHSPDKWPKVDKTDFEFK